MLPDFPKSVQLQISRVCATNTRVSGASSRENLSEIITNYTASPMFSSKSFPNDNNSLRAVPDKFNSHAKKLENNFIELYIPEIEKELKRAHEEAIIRRHEELRAKELRLHAERLSQLESERGQDLRVNKHEEFRALRDGHPLTKSDSSSRLDLLNHSAFLDRNYHRAGSLSPHSATSASPTGEGPAHHWTFE